MRTIVALVILAAAAPAAAETQVTVGASAGLFQNKEDAAAGVDSTETLGLWGRVGFSKRLSGQLEITRHKSQEGCAQCTFGTATDIRVFSAMLVVDLKDGGRWMPTLIAGMGLDRDDGSIPAQGHHIEGGFGLEYRADGGLTVGLDGRLGGRSIDEQAVGIQADDGVAVGGTGAVAFLGPTTMRAGEYRTIRLTLGIRF